MKSKKLWVVLGLLTCLSGAALSVRATTLYWEGAYPSALWDTTSTYWSTTDGVAPNATFTDGDDVIFGKYYWYSTNSKSATVDLNGGSVSAHSLTFSIPSGTSGITYTLQNGTITLNNTGISLSKTGVRGDNDILNTSIVLGSSTTWDVQIGTVNVNGVVSGAGNNIVKTGAGAVAFAGTGNTYGNLSINDGTVSSAMTTGNYAFGGTMLVIGDGVGTSGSAMWVSAGTGGNGYQQLVGKNVTINSDGILKLGSGGTNNMGEVTFAGGLMNAASGTQIAAVTKIMATANTTQNESSVAEIRLVGAGGQTEIAVNSGVTLTIGNVLSQSDSFLKTGDGTLVLSGANTFNNTAISTAIRAGTVRVMTSSMDLAAGALGRNTAAAASRIVNLGDASSGSSDVTFLHGVENITTQRQLNVSASGTGIVTIGGDHTTGVSTYSAFTGSSSVVLNRSANFTAATGGTVVFANAVTGAGGVKKVGGGKVVYNVANSYAGDTDISEGTLALKDSATLGAGAVTLRSGATFDISGLSAASYAVTQTFSGAGNLEATGKTLQLAAVFNAGGESATGLLSVTGGLTLQSAATSKFELNGINRGIDFDAINISGLLTLDGAIVVTGSGFASGNSYDLLDWNTIDYSGFNLSTDLFLPTLAGALTWDTSRFLIDGTIAVVPEPSTYALLGLSIFVLSLGWKGRRRI